MDEKSHRGRKGPAPVASLEDLSDDSPPEGKARLALPGIREDPARMIPGGPTTPRIDISRASSSSHQDDSSPERELLAGGTEAGGGGAKFGLGFTEEMAQELRSSTEELDFQDPADEADTKSRRKKLQSQQAVTKYELEAQSEKETKERKDSACSEGGFLFIGGRTSRLSSIGSAASGGSVASALSGGSAASAASRLSAASNYSKASRCSSPHRMMLETSFCGPKPIPSLSVESQDPEAALLSRQADPTGAVLPKLYAGKNELKPKGKEAKPAGESKPHRRPKKTSRPKKKPPEDALVRIVPLHGSVDEPEESEEETPRDEPAGPPSPPEYGIYIPLKGPDPMERKTEDVVVVVPPRTPQHHRPQPPPPPPVEENDLVRFISLHGDDDEDLRRSRKEQLQNKNGHNVQFRPRSDEGERRRNPEPKTTPRRLDLATKQNLAQASRAESRTPSPATSFSRGSIFRRSSDSSSSSKRSHGCGDKSRKDSKNKSVFTSLFKKSPRDKSASGHSNDPSTYIDSKITNVEFKFKQEERKQDESDTIIIPLHSPDSIPEPLILNEPDTSDSNKPDLSNKRLIFSKGASPEVTNDASQKLAKNVIVVDVINEDKIVSMDDLKDLKPAHPISDSNKKEENEKFKISEKSDQVREKERSQVSLRKENSYDLMKQELQESWEKDIGPPDIIKKVPSPVEQSKIINKSPEVSLPSKAEVPSKLVKSTAVEEAVPPPVHSVNDTSSSYTATENVDNLPDKSIPENKSPEAEVTGELSSSAGKEKENEKEAEYFPARSSTTESENTVIENHFAVQEEHRSSGSETEPEHKDSSIEDDTERKSLFQQTDSVEDELPYVPTTLPQERSVGVPIIPVKQRVSEIKTYPIERPRSTTPINPTCLDDYTSHDESSTSSSSSGKMQIILPRSDSTKSSKFKSPGRAKPWSIFAEECLQSPKENRRTDAAESESPPPPPLPPRGPAQSWVCFDEVPERKRAPKRITTLPSRPHQSNVVYSYVNPEECSCECHDPSHS